MHNIKNVTDDIIWVGGNDRRLTLFEGVYPLSRGVAYNSYIVLDEKTVLFDTVDKAISGLYFENVAAALSGRKLDYFIIQHLEPDHAANIAEIMRRYPEAEIVCNAKAAAMIGQFFGIEVSGTVKEGDTLTTGRHTFTFVNAPMVHWPEVMMTYDVTDRILFSADAFGTFGAQNGALFADEVNFESDYLNEARRYYTNIVGKYGAQVQTVLKKAAGLEISMICPLHGFVWRENIGSILEKYMAWSSYTPEENAVVIIYGSIYGNTENAVEILASALRKKGVKTVLYDASVTHYSWLLSACFKYSHIVLASPTYNGGLFTPMENFVNVLCAHNLQSRTFAFIENGSWAAQSAKLMRDKIGTLKNTTILENTVSFKSAVNDEAVESLTALADAITDSIPVEVPVQYSIDKKILNNISYGLFVLSANDGVKDNGCIINTLCQVSSDPLRVSISVNKANYTHDIIMKTGVFNVSILSENVDFGLIEHFGFQSGRDVDKYEGCTKSKFSENSLRYTIFGTNSFISAKVCQTIDLGSHTLFIADVTEAGKISDSKSLTYAYYHENIKPKTEKTPEKKGYVCSICGYVYEGDELPEDFVCPLCKHPASDFVKL